MSRAGLVSKSTLFTSPHEPSSKPSQSRAEPKRTRNKAPRRDESSWAPIQAEMSRAGLRSKPSADPWAKPRAPSLEPDFQSEPKKTGHVDMLTLTCNSLVNQHFLPVPHEPSPEPELSETNRAENKAPSRTKMSRIWPRGPNKRAKRSRAEPNLEPTGTEPS